MEGAKVVTNAKSPGSRCYGLVTMGSADEASKCIQYLHRTELSGRMISVERVSDSISFHFCALVILIRYVEIPHASEFSSWIYGNILDIWLPILFFS